MQFSGHFSTIDTHTAGEPLRIITSGVPFLQGKTMLDKRTQFAEHFDHIRQTLMYEPRGHHGMYGCVVMPPESSNADFGVLFMRNEGFSTMCGHGIIAVVTALIETGQLYVKGADEPIIIDSPAGQIVAYADCAGSEVKSVTFNNVPSFVFEKEHVLESNVKAEIAYGGAFYVIVDAKAFDVRIEIEQLAKIQQIAKQVKEEIERKVIVQHPLEKKINGIYGVIFTDEPQKENSDMRSVTIFADQQIDRSPCGTGTSALLASLYENGKLQEATPFVNESVIGSQFVGTITGTARVGDFEAVIPQIKGRAFITGLHQFFIDPDDPLSAGFLLK
ncbi:proline racemase family protein [Fictibacillus gelatini]|uniref:proline racemase family protein n=1 Tax=Fictibacillus gelatini TaxID=225985 RepID=UPI00040228B4|nr:proline racemase family protein [Fictibacillus gelatini]